MNFTLKCNKIDCLKEFLFISIIELHGADMSKRAIRKNIQIEAIKKNKARDKWKEGRKICIFLKYSFNESENIEKVLIKTVEMVKNKFIFVLDIYSNTKHKHIEREEEQDEEEIDGKSWRKKKGEKHMEIFWKC